MADRAVLAATKRTILGKKVAQLRRQGRIPANVYGRGIDSIAIELDAREFGRSIKTSGIRSMFELALEGEGATRPVVLRGLMRQGGTGDPLHVDFYQVDPTRPIHANVTIRVVGESPAVRDLAGTLLVSSEVVAVRCLPLSIPEAIEADVSVLKNFEISLTVADLVAPEGVEILTDPSVVLATVNPPRIRLERAEGEADAEED